MGFLHHDFEAVFFLNPVKGMDTRYGTMVLWCYEHFFRLGRLLAFLS